MLIGISGSSNSGKTTLASLLGAEMDACVVGEVASYVAGVWKKEKEMSLAEIRAYDATRFQLEVLEEQIRREDEALQSHEIVIVDRTIYDDLFFALFYHDDLQLLKRYMRILEERERQRQYDLILYCEPIEGDNSSRIEHQIIRRLLPQHIPVCHLPAFPPKKRVRIAVKVIEEVFSC
ncbi:AAA family ATPase [Archaeoglobus neptunius]|uniref:AAA family ATPase n=1 Tax=Archaeoglobus neptunius TaxID=2798580 RepID=UPI0019289574|nr:AAA family ATPase [Archaeoglobus neptunius]